MKDYHGYPNLNASNLAVYESGTTRPRHILTPAENSTPSPSDLGGVSGVASRVKMQTLKTRLTETSIDLWLALFPITYLIHIAEEYWVGEGYPAYILRIRGVHLSPARFWLAQSIGVVLITIGVLLARHLLFPRMMLVILGTTVLGNGLTHGITSLSLFGYGPGLVSSVFIWIPLGILTLLRVKDETTRKRFWIGVAIGVAANIGVGIITMRGGRLA